MDGGASFSTLVWTSMLKYFVAENCWLKFWNIFTLIVARLTLANIPYAQY